MTQPRRSVVTSETPPPNRSAAARAEDAPMAASQPPGRVTQLESKNLA
jgi:hypothetical protein